MELSSSDKLFSCLECGARISPNAANCPKCETKYFRGVVCGLCEQTMKFSEANTWDKIDQHPVRAESSSSIFHSACLQTIVPDVLPERLPCKECATLISVSSVVTWSNPSGYKQSPCPECGSPHRFEQSSCERCNIPVFPAGHHCILTQPRADTFNYLHGDGCYHATCYQLHIQDLLDNAYVSVFEYKLRYQAEYRKGQLVRETSGDECARSFLGRRCKKAREQGKREVAAMGLNGPFVYLWGVKIQQTGIASKNIGLRNLSGSERELARKLQGWGYSLFDSQYPFKLMVRL